MPTVKDELPPELHSSVWPNVNDKCWDCGSSIPGHHTPHCDFSVAGDVLDLPMVEGTQWWDEEAPKLPLKVKK